MITDINSIPLTVRTFDIVSIDDGSSIFATHTCRPDCTMATAVTMSGGLEISALDERRYACITLDNGLQVLLVSDPKTEKASAAMDVHVGHQSDPEELPGLAHFLEHMLFLGTTKYPDENSYKQFLSAHSGRSNASTSQMHTNFYFDVLSDHFHLALDRFAQFFIAPLFTASATDREMNAVNSENSKNLQNDHRRLYQLQKSLANPAHPFHKFGTGNIDTLGHGPRDKGIDVRAALLDFHATYYSASIMKLVLYGKEDVGTLEQWARELFSPIRNTGRDFPTFGNVVPYDDTRLQRLVQVAPVKNLRLIDVSWPLPSLYLASRTKPSKILSHLIGHEGPGSLLSYLKAQKWANGLSAGLSRDNEDWSLFSVKVDATEAGITQMDAVVGAIYQYVHMLQREAPFEPWIFEETKDLAAVEFRFKAKETPISYTSYLATVMHKYPTSLIVSGGYLLYEYDADAVQGILNALVPQRMRLTVVSKQFEGKTQAVERWYGTPYTESPVDAALLDKWTKQEPNSALHLPHRNEFICSDFAVVTPPATTVPEADRAPHLLRDDEQCRLWFQPDSQFRKPKHTLSFLLYSPSVSPTPYHAVLTGLFVRYLKDELTECAYDAELAGMEYEISFSSRAVEFFVEGYSQKLPILLAKVLHQLVDMTKPGHEFAPAVFERIKDRTKRMYENFFLEEPYQHCVYAGSVLLEASKWSVDDKLRAIEQLTLGDLAAHAQGLFQQLFIESFFYGNLDAAESNAIMADVLRAFAFGEPGGSFPLLSSQRSRPRIVQLADNVEYKLERRAWNLDNCNSAVCVLFQLEDESMALRARLELFAHVFKEPCFNQLRTQEQLGYLVFSGIMRTEGVEYFRVLLQSDVAAPPLLGARIEAFLLRFRRQLVDMAPDVWAKHVHAVVKALREKPKQEQEECMRAWREIANEAYCFDRRHRVAAIVATLHKRDLLAFFDEFIAAGGVRRSKLSIGLYGDAHPLAALAIDDRETTGTNDASVGLAAAAALEEQLTADETPTKAEVVEIRDMDAFKHQMRLFPERARCDGLAVSGGSKL